MRKILTLVIVSLAACAGNPSQPENPAPKEPRVEYSSPDWSSHTLVAAITSGLDPDKQRLLFSATHASINRDLTQYADHIMRLQTTINSRIEMLEVAIQEFRTTPDKDSSFEDGYIDYCANFLAEIELLRIQLHHKGELLRIKNSIEKLRDSLR